jgi:hypothetical protein
MILRAIGGKLWGPRDNQTSAIDVSTAKNFAKNGSVSRRSYGAKQEKTTINIGGANSMHA